MCPSAARFRSHGLCTDLPPHHFGCYFPAFFEFVTETNFAYFNSPITSHCSPPRLTTDPVDSVLPVLSLSFREDHRDQLKAAPWSLVQDLLGPFAHLSSASSSQRPHLCRLPVGSALIPYKPHLIPDRCACCPQYFRSPTTRFPIAFAPLQFIPSYCILEKEVWHASRTLCLFFFAALASFFPGIPI